MFESQRSRTIVGIARVIILSVSFTALAQLDKTRGKIELNLAERRENIITFMCRDTVQQQPIPDVLYFLNGTRLDNFTNFFMDDGNDVDQVTFWISRDLEGCFTCGNTSLISNSISLIAYPDRSLLPIPPLAHAITGEQVQLKCAIPPGQLIQQYSVTWDRSERIIDTTNDDRYSVNASDLSLIINNVRLSDTSDEYHCVFTVRDPNGMDSRSYETMQDRDIPLVILGNFSRINVEITDRRNVIFTIELGVRYTQEVRLSLLYTNAMNTSQTEEVRTSTVVKNGTNISHFECGGQVPFTKFRVQVRLMFPEDIYGPYHVLHDVYDINLVTECVAATEKEHTIIPVGAAFGACILILAVVLVVVLCYFKKGNTKHLDQFKTEIIAEIRSAGKEAPTSQAQNSGTKPDKTRCINADSGSAVELGDMKKLEEYGALVSFVSDTLLAALENPQIRDQVKRSVDPMVKRYWQN